MPCNKDCSFACDLLQGKSIMDCSFACDFLVGWGFQGLVLAVPLPMHEILMENPQTLGYVN